MRLIDSLRTLFRIRTRRRRPPAGPKPPIGSSIVNDRLRMRLTFPISHEQWNWLTEMGWRTTDMRTDRRQYALVSETFVYRMLDADEEQRYQLHQRLLASQPSLH